ncbi:MAG TPA: cation-transporting P-type ATPase [Gaiellaceae bacterium]|jgi:Ca2+-transporting ATPase|nr:cation-transporting P-type ATPase [Gaiellaceae bacterium]
MAERRPPERVEAPPSAGEAHALSAGEAAAALETDPAAGLSEPEAGRRLARYGPNAISEEPGPRYLQIAARQLTDPLVVLLILAAVVSAAIGETAEAVAIGIIVVLNATLGFVQEAGAERALVALREQFTPVAAVVRAGVERTIAAVSLVPGDLVVLREGDRVPADGRVVDTMRLEADESALTGESLPVEKTVAPVAAEAALAERPSMVYAGTGVTKGHGRAIVTATGEATEMGRVATLAQQAERPPTPLQQQLGKLARLLGVVGILITVFLTVLLLARGESLREAFLVGVAVAVAAVPEGLSATVTIALALGARSMAERGAIVRRLAAIETLGRTSVICTDKTGTLTENRLRLTETIPASGRTEDDVLAAAVLASSAEASVDGSDGDGRQSRGDPVESAILQAAQERGIDRSTLSESRSLVYEVPFDSNAKRMTMVYDEPNGRHSFVKGAPEEVFARADSVDPDLVDEVPELASDGLRVLAVAHRQLDDDGAAPDEDLDVIGLVALQDPLRASARPSVQEARAAGIRVRMLTGDHPATAASIGRQLGLSDQDIDARVDPEQKLDIVQELEHAGETVAVTGDGVNDAPALRAADVGVAMGRSGTEAARESADVVLTDDDFATIVAAVREGRRITDNVRKVVAFLLSANLGEVLLFCVTIIAGVGVPMTVVQVLTVNILTDGLPALALARDPAEPGIMRRPPERGGALFGRPLIVALFIAGSLVGVAAVAAYLVGREIAPEQAQTMTYATVALAELAAVYSFRSTTEAAWRMPRNPYLFAGVAVSFAILAITIYVPALAGAWGTVELGARELGIAFGLALLPAALIELAKAIYRARALRSEGSLSS